MTCAFGVIRMKTVEFENKKSRILAKQRGFTTSPTGEKFRALNKELRKLISEYIKDCVHKFI
jgi:hypothetical protein